MEEIISATISELEETIQTNPTQNLSLSTLENLQSLLDTNDPQVLAQFFIDLSSKSISIASLLSPLTSTMDSGPTHLSLLSSKSYLSLLLSPNSPVFTLFTPMSFLSLLRSIRRSLKPSPLPSGGSGGAPQIKKRKLKKNNNKRESDTEGFDARLFFCVLEKLGLVLDSIHLNRFPESLKSLIHTVVEIPVLAIEMGVVNFNRLADFCSIILRQVLKSEHGKEGETAAEVLKSLTPLILSGKSQARSFALGFVKDSVTCSDNENERVKKAVFNLPRYLIKKAPEKAEGRGLAVEAIMEIVGSMTSDDQVGFVKYVVRITQGKTNLRLLGVDLILNLMMMLKDPFGVDLGYEVKDSWGFDCLEALIQRCSDSSAGIRARALSNLAQLVGFLLSKDKNGAVLNLVLGFGEINELLRNRCMDEKANARRAALVLVSKLIALMNGNFDGILLKTMGMACSDPLISIRKAAISALSEALRMFPDEIVITEWLHSVPRLITDNESSMQEECENLFLELVLDRISRAGSPGTLDKESTSFRSNVKEKDIEIPEGVLILLKEICNGDVTPWVRKICANLGKKKKLKPKLATALQSIIRTSESLWLSHSKPIEKWTAPPGAWFLLSEVSAYLTKAVDWEFLHHHWQLLDKFGGEPKLNNSVGKGIMHEDEEDSESNSVAWAGDRVFLLQTISNVSVELPAESAADLAHNLLKRIEEFNMHSTEVNAHVKALKILCKRKALDSGEADALVMKWAKQVLSRASKMLEKYISGNVEANNINSFFTPPRSQKSNGKRGAAMCRLLSEVVTAAYTIGSLVIVCPSVDVSSVVPVLHTIITSGNSDPKLSKLPGPRVSLKQTAPSLYIQAWLTMGKICLADGKLAKRYIPLFVQELEKSDCAALRNNLVVTMADFCVRYTALVDCYISKITKCLRDPCELVRRQTFILLSRLLQMDYVKWRGVLFLRFLLSLVDESAKIRQLSDFLFGSILKVKAPLLAYNSFVEAIYVLNDCNAHNGLGGSKNSQTENRLFSIRGSDENARAKRMHVYVSLLKQMAPEHLLATFAKLCAEILAAASDGMLSIEDIAGQAVLQDAFQILACKEIRISPGRSSQTDAGEIEDEGGESGASAAAAKGRAVTQAIRKGLIQNTIPIFIELKRLLESKNSLLMGSLMECLRILLKDYKNEIDDILVADKQLQKELIYDMQKYESNEAKITAAQAVATMQKPSSFLSPGVPKTANRTAQGQNKFPDNLHNDARVASAMADATAAARARSVLKEVNKGSLTPPLSAISVPKLKSNQGASGAQNDRPLDVLESLRRRQSFNSDDEN
ncbi:condensin, putative [Ricinus communis]|uniref:Condensin, putative n=1 Tax=Ricinus communis TaxID=3988 RepID=B9RT64_RICCO|nr:condensin, putative [Ricinus communis]|eukprot:XP_002516933.1 condensin-2 complex subunit D3 [Ricinus communis]